MNNYDEIKKILPYFKNDNDKISQGSFYSQHVSSSLLNDTIIDVVIFGISDEEGLNEYKSADSIRASLYKLAPLSKSLNILDLGNYLTNAGFDRNNHQISEIVNVLLKYNIKIIIIGGTSEVTGKLIYNYYRFEHLPLNLVSINSIFTWDHLPLEPLADNPLKSVKENLINFINIGYQNYFLEKEMISFINDAQFEAYRLGLVRNNTINFEPLIRDGNVLNISFNVVKFSDAPGARKTSPNGITGDEFCQFAYYAGYSSRINIYSINDLDVRFDCRDTTSLLGAQALWYIFEGLVNNIQEDPGLTPDNFIKYHIHLNITNQDLAFYFSNVTNRWWMEVIIENKREILISCTQNDYELACNQEIPDRWWRLFNRMDE